eukprot:scaffold178974_cov42-Prasinocladus_malaysianus.AAC.1
MPLEHGFAVERKQDPLALRRWATRPKKRDNHMVPYRFKFVICEVIYNTDGMPESAVWQLMQWLCWKSCHLAPVLSLLRSKLRQNSLWSERLNGGRIPTEESFSCIPPPVRDADSSTTCPFCGATGSGGA